MSNAIRVSTQQLNGISLQEIICEAFVIRGVQNFSISGLPDSILKDSKDKLRALIHSHVSWDPLQRLVVHLLPPESAKCGAHLELAIFLASITALSEDLKRSEVFLKNLSLFRFYGSLSLDRKIIDTQESSLLIESDEKAIGAAHFQDLDALMEALLTVDFSIEKPSLQFQTPSPSQLPKTTIPKVEGRYFERFALLLGAILNEPVLLIGPPGVGKTYLGNWARYILPPPKDVHEVKRIWSLSENTRDPHEAPFLNPHARSQRAEFLGYRKQNKIYPGYFSLCHQGILLLDEFPELSRDIREVLRNVLDTREIKSLHGRSFFIWPAQFWLIATANPCACGEALPRDLGRCRCTRSQLQNYLQRFSGPLLDRIGIQIFMNKDSNTMQIPDLDSHIKKLLDSDQATLQAFVFSQRTLFEKSQDQDFGKTRKDFKKSRLRKALHNFNIAENTLEQSLCLLSEPAIKSENFR